MITPMLYKEFKVPSLLDKNSMKRVHLLQLSQLNKMFKSMDKTREFFLKNLEESA